MMTTWLTVTPPGLEVWHTNRRMHMRRHNPGARTYHLMTHII